MILRFVLWNLADSKTTVQELRRYLRDEAVDAFAEVPGLRFKAWVSDLADHRPTSEPPCHREGDRSLARRVRPAGVENVGCLE